MTKVIFKFKENHLELAEQLGKRSSRKLHLYNEIRRFFENKDENKGLVNLLDIVMPEEELMALGNSMTYRGSDRVIRNFSAYMGELLGHRKETAKFMEESPLRLCLDIKEDVKILVITLELK